MLVFLRLVQPQLSHLLPAHFLPLQQLQLLPALQVWQQLMLVQLVQLVQLERRRLL